MVNAIAGSLVIKVSDKGSPETPRSAEGECALVHRKMGKNTFWKKDIYVRAPHSLNPVSEIVNEPTSFTSWFEQKGFAFHLV